MRILITAAIFNNTISMGSRRPRAIAQILADRGHDVTVIAAATAADATSQPPPGVRVLSPVPIDSDVFKTGRSLPFWKRLAVAVAVLPTYPSVVLNSPRIASLLRNDPTRAAVRLDELNKKRYRTALTIKTLLEDYRWARQSSRALTPALENEVPFDVVFSTFGPLGSLWLGERLFKKFGRSWVADFRDPMRSPDSLLPVRIFLKHQRRRVFQRADAVTVVSKGFRQSLLSDPRLAPLYAKCFVVTNGFLNAATHQQPCLDSDLRVKDKTLRIVYTGMIYQDRQDPAPLFAAIREIKMMHPDSEIEISYAGKNSHLIKEVAAAYNLEDSLVTHGIISHDEATQLQANADILLALSWNAPDYQGVLPGKFLEYLGTGKPVISLIAGTEPNSELASISNAVNVGIAVEATEGDAGIERLTKYLEDALVSKRETGSVHFAPDEEKRSKYSYERISARLEKIFEETLVNQEKYS